MIGPVITSAGCFLGQVHSQFDDAEKILEAALKILEFSEIRWGMSQHSSMLLSTTKLELGKIYRF